MTGYETTSVLVGQDTVRRHREVEPAVTGALLGKTEDEYVGNT